LKYDFADERHAAGYLTGSVVRTKDGTPIQVREIFSASGNLWVVAGFLVPCQNVKNVALDDLDLSPVPIGMCNIEYKGHLRDAVYLARQPERRWKVGLTQNSTRIHPIRPGVDNVMQYIPITSWWWGGSLHRTILGEFPSWETAREMMKNNIRRSIAVSRNFALTGDGKLMYRTNPAPVGEWTGYEPVLEPGYELLYETLMEDWNAPHN
jgi:hypothetical protein